MFILLKTGLSSERVGLQWLFTSLIPRAEPVKYSLTSELKRFEDYIELNLKLCHLIGQTFSERPRISRGLDKAVIELFNVSPDEVEKIKEKEQLVQQMPRTLRGLDKEVIELFNVSPNEVEKINEKEQSVQPRKSAFDYN